MEPTMTVGEITAKNFRAAEVFKKHKIDFCCGGKKTLEKVCNEKGISMAEINNELDALDTQTRNPELDFNSWDPGFLADYIVNTHHQYVTSSIPLIFEYTQKVARVHGAAHPEAVEAARLFVNVVDELKAHMMKEENILFPYIKHLSEAKKSGIKPDAPHFGTVLNPIRMMEHEHDVAGNLMKEIRKVTHNYLLPEGACNSFRYAYSKLQEFEDDLHRHIHLENNILFPKSVQLEDSLNA